MKKILTALIALNLLVAMITPHHAHPLPLTDFESLKNTHGVDEKTKYKVIQEGSSFPVGTVLTFLEDDGTNYLPFIDKKGVKNFAWFYELEIYEL